MKKIGFIYNFKEDVHPNSAFILYRATSINQVLNNYDNELFLYNPNHIDQITFTVIGYIIKDNKFVTIKSNIPNINIDCYLSKPKTARKTYLSKSKFQTWAIKNNISIYPAPEFGEILKDKCLTYEIMRSSKFNAHPYTELLNKPILQIKRFFYLSDIIYIKPNLGCMGNNIFVLKKQGNEYVVNYYLKKKKTTKIYNSIKDLIKNSNFINSKREFIIQQGINVPQYQNCSFIIRDIIIDDGTNWQHLLKAVISSSNSDIANTTQGGNNKFIDVVLGEIYGENNTQGIINKIKQTSLMTINHLNKHFPNKLMEVAFDYVMDIKGNIFIAEINTKPGMTKPGMPLKNVFNDILNQTIEEKIIYDKYILPHGTHLANFLHNKTNQSNSSGCISNNLQATSLKDKKLFTPGPLTTSLTVKKACLKDLGSRDLKFINVIKQIRQQLLDASDLSNKDYTVIPMQGSGTFGIEAVISSIDSNNCHWLVLSNGIYAQRITQIIKLKNLPITVFECPTNETFCPNKLDLYLKNNPSISHVAIVHCETSSGMVNDIHNLSHIVNKYNKNLLIDAMSSFGAIDTSNINYDYLISSSNKCLEGLPGFSFIIAKIKSLKLTKNRSTILAFDIYQQWQALEKNGQFRFTPPVQSILAFAQALKEWQQEGGVSGRSKRYKKNNQILIKGMIDLGFKPYLKPNENNYIITSFHYLESTKFDFNILYENLSDLGSIIYPGKLLDLQLFRIGNIGHIFADDIKNLLKAIKQSLISMKITS